MASPTPPASNTITISIPLAVALISAFLAVAGWGASLAGKVSEGERWRVTIENRMDGLEAKVAAQNTALGEQIAKSNAATADNYARQTAQNAQLQETITGVRIELARRR
jgi:uncharacterized coiled-coil protein SlyX